MQYSLRFANTEFQARAYTLSYAVGIDEPNWPRIVKPHKSVLIRNTGDPYAISRR